MAIREVIAKGLEFKSTMIANNTLSSVVDDHTKEMDVIWRDLAQLNTIVNARMDRLETFMNANIVVIQAQIEKLTTIM